MGFYDYTGKEITSEEFLEGVADGWHAFVLHIACGNFTFPNAVLTTVAFGPEDEGLECAIEAYEEHLVDIGADVSPNEFGESWIDSDLAHAEPWGLFILRNPDWNTL